MTKWWKEAVGYQIYPRSFLDVNQDGIGDLKGVTAKLPYLKKLGIDFIWLTPIFASPNVDNGYDISDYQAIAPEFGTMADFHELVKEAKALGIKLILDLVINHTSNQHEWFKQSCLGKDNPYSDYYIWHPPVNGKEPNDWQSIFGGSVWEYHEGRGEYYFHAFAKEQPDLNWESEQMKKDVFEMIEWWIAQGIDGFRIDAISHVKKANWDTPIDPTNVSAPYQNVTGIDKYLNELSALLRKHGMMSVGEASGVTATEAPIWVGDDGYFDMIFEFEHINLWRDKTDEGVAIKPFKDALIRWQHAVADDKGWNALYMENHDVPRSISAFGNDAPEWREKSGKALAMAYMLLQGTPFIYQGQEIGMINNEFRTIEDIDAVDSRHLYYRLREEGLSEAEAMSVVSETTRDNARTPMQWNDSHYAGFSETTPWLAVNQSKDWINVADALSQPDSLFHFYQTLIQLRKTHAAFIDGKFLDLSTDNEDVFAYQRFDDKECFTIVVNLSQKVCHETWLSDYQEDNLILSNQSTHNLTTLEPFEARLYRH